MEDTGGGGGGGCCPGGVTLARGAEPPIGRASESDAGGTPAGRDGRDTGACSPEGGVQDSRADATSTPAVDADDGTDGDWVRLRASGGGPLGVAGGAAGGRATGPGTVTLSGSRGAGTTAGSQFGA